MIQRYSLRHILFIASVLLQFAVLFGLIFFYQSIVIGGTEIILKTQPIDPRDLLRGSYVNLNYEISSPGSLVEPSQFLNGDTVYVSLARDTGGVWWATGASRAKPTSGIFLKGMVVDSGGFRSMTVRYGIESYFVDPERASELETAARRGALYMRVAVDSNGTGVVRGVADTTGYNSPSGNLLTGEPRRTPDVHRVADIQELRMALELYFDANGTYVAGTQAALVAALVPTYISAIPTAPAPGSYMYQALNGAAVACDTAPCISYILRAQLEEATNGALRSDVDGIVGGVNCADNGGVVPDTNRFYCARP